MATANQFRFFAITASNEVAGTNDEKVALALAADEDYIVIDTRDNKVIIVNKGTTDLIDIPEQTSHQLG